MSLYEVLPDRCCGENLLPSLRTVFTKAALDGVSPGDCPFTHGVLMALCLDRKEVEKEKQNNKLVLFQIVALKF